jgi:hypothetical protein
MVAATDCRETDEHPGVKTKSPRATRYSLKVQVSLLYSIHMEYVQMAGGTGSMMRKRSNRSDETYGQRGDWVMGPPTS